MNKKREAIIFLWIHILIAAFLICGSPCIGVGGVWIPVERITTRNLMGIWGSSSSDIFAVGDGGTILHYNGQIWSTMASGTTYNLTGIWGSSPTDVFAVRERGIILHYDGSAWSHMASGATGYLTDVWGSSPTDVFVGGDFFHYDGSTWSPIIVMIGPFPIYFPTISIWGSSGTNVFVACSNSTILHYNGTSWSPMPIGTNKFMFRIWGISENDVYVVGENGLIIHYNGTTWSPMTSGTTNHLFGIWGNSVSDIFAVGNWGTILHYNATSWSPMSTGTSKFLYSIWGSSESDVYAVGNEGTILHYIDLNFKMFLPLTLNEIHRICPGGPGSSPILNTITISPNSVPASNTTQVYVQFSFSDPDGDLDYGTLNYVAPSGQTVSIPLPGSLAGISSAVVGSPVIITTDSQKGTFKIPTWLRDKAGNCSQVVYVDWTQY